MSQPANAAPSGEPAGGTSTDADAPTTARRRRVRRYVAAIAGATILVGAATAYAVLSQPESEQSKIQKTVTDFASAVDEVDIPKVVSLLCPQEATSIIDNSNDPLSATDRVTSVKPRPITISNIQIKGTIASAVVIRPSQQPVTVYLEKDGTTWKLCAPAGVPAP